MIDGGETYTVKFLFTKADLSLDSVLATFDVVDNWNVDFYLEDGSKSVDYEFCHKSSDQDYRAYYTYGTQNAVGLGTFSSSIGGSPNLGSSASNIGQVTYDPINTVTNELITYNYTLLPSGCVIDTSHNISVYDLPAPTITNLATDTPHYCIYDTEVFTPVPFGSSGSFSWGSGLGTAAITNQFSGGTKLVNIADVGTFNNYIFSTGTSRLCIDGHDYGSTTNITSPSFTVTTTYTSAEFSLYYTLCTGTAPFEIYLNGNLVYTIPLSGTGCTCSPATTYPEVISVNGSVMDPFWNIGGSNTFTISHPQTNVAFAGATVNLINSAGNNGAFDASEAEQGIQSIIYSYTDGNGCLNDTTYHLFIDSLIDVQYSVPELLNIANGDTMLMAEFDSAGIASSFFSSSSAGITNPSFGGTDTTNFGTFSPTASGLDTFDIVFNYTDTNSCSFTISDTVIVQKLKALSSRSTPTIVKVW